MKQCPKWLTQSELEGTCWLHLQMEVARTGAEGKIVGGRVHGGLLEPCWGRAYPGVQLDLVATDVMIVVVCAVEGVGTGTRREVSWQVLHPYNDS